MQDKKRFSSKEVISASEIGQYHFCSMSWYLQKMGYKPVSTSLKTGIVKHNKHAKILSRSKRVNQLSIAAAITGYLILFLSLLFLFFEVIL